MPSFLKGQSRHPAGSFKQQFEAKMEMTATAKICQPGSRKVSYWKELAEAGGDQEVTLSRTSLKTLGIHPRDA
jgi:hypothetical protein